MSLRVRFALWVAALLVVVLTTFGAFVYLSLARSMATSIDDSLRLSGSEAIATVNVENGQIDVSDAILEGSDAADLRERGLTVRVLDPTGRVIQAYGPYRDLTIDRAGLTAAASGRSTFASLVDAVSHQPVRVYTTPVAEDGRIVGIVQVMHTLADLRSTQRRLLALLLFGGPFLVLVAALGGYVLAARVLAPIDHITRTARHISAADLSARLDLPPTDDEVGRLATTLDEMLVRLDDSFRRERQFTADASHELRTPLAAMQAILSVIRAKSRSTEDYEHALADLSDEVDRLRDLAENLLLLARSDDRTTAPIHEAIDLSALVSDVCDALRPTAAAKGLTLTCDAPAGLAVLGDGDSLIRLFVNLVDNAIHSTIRGSIRVTARGEGRTVVIGIADTGSGIAPEALPHIFDRFFQADTSRSERGAGLGLAIALAIAREHGGTIEVASVVGEGTTFTVTLPTER